MCCSYRFTPGCRHGMSMFPKERGTRRISACRWTDLASCDARSGSSTSAHIPERGKKEGKKGRLTPVYPPRCCSTLPLNDAEKSRAPKIQKLRSTEAGVTGDARQKSCSRRNQREATQTCEQGGCRNFIFFSSQLHDRNGVFLREQKRGIESPCRPVIVGARGTYSTWTTRRPLRSRWCTRLCITRCHCR